jgi:glycosyltransferase involved in cell wall biosynthesis
VSHNIPQTIQRLIGIYNLKLVIISSLYGVKGGGSGIITFHLAHGLKDRGHRVSVLTLGINHRYSVADQNGIRVYQLKPFNLYRLEEKDTRPLWQRMLWQTLDIYNLHAARLLREFLREESPDIVHIHKMRGFSGSVWSVASRLFPGKVIQTCHDYESMSPDGLLRGVVGRMALEKKWPVRGYQSIRARLSHGVSMMTAPSQFTLRRITDSGLFPTARRRVIANTHGWSEQELQSIQADKDTFSSHAIRFLFLGRLETEKGICELCEAFRRAFGVEQNIELVIAGWGTLESQLHQRYGGHPGIRFLGKVDGESKTEALRNATVVVVPSLVEEVFGIVTIEAYAFGKPVIASNVGGLPELVRQDETGWLVEPGNVDALAQRMLSVTKIAPSALAKMSQACKEYSYQFSMEKITAEYLELYEQLLK